jgi:hypothetical protein
VALDRFLADVAKREHGKTEDGAKYGNRDKDASKGLHRSKLSLHMASAGMTPVFSPKFLFQKKKNILCFKLVNK